MTPQEIAADYNLPLDAVREAIACSPRPPPRSRQTSAETQRAAEATGINDPQYKLGGRYRILSPQERGSRPGL